jgi:hypothetical protein
VAVLALGACGSPKPKTEVLGVQFTRPEVTTTTSVALTTTVPTPAPTTALPVATTAVPRARATVEKTAVAPVPGSIAGTLLSAGDPVSGAEVTVSNGGGAVARTTTTTDGAFRVDGLPPGQYRVAVSDHGDDAPVCDTGGACVTKRPPSEHTADVIVAPGAVTTSDFSS